MYPDLSILDVTLRNLDGPLPIEAVRAHALNGMFYSELDRRYPWWVQDLHQPRANAPLPFSLSPIFQDGYFLGFRAAALTSETGQRVREVWEDLAEHQTVIRLGSARMAVSGVERGKPWPATYEKIHETSPVKLGVRLAFETPMRFEPRGRLDLLPKPKMLWGWYATRWEAFSGIALPPEFLRWVEMLVNVIEIDVETVFAYIEKEIEWKGIVGEVAFQAFADSPDVPLSRLPDYLRAFQELAMLAEYSGTGEKTGMGMGMTRRVRTFSPFRDGAGWRTLVSSKEDNDETD
jgi:CRISPR-associated endoribonuclease Cas6